MGGDCWRTSRNCRCRRRGRPIIPPVAGSGSWLSSSLPLLASCWGGEIFAVDSHYSGMPEDFCFIRYLVAEIQTAQIRLKCKPFIYTGMTEILPIWKSRALKQIPTWRPLDYWGQIVLTDKDSESNIGFFSTPILAISAFFAFLLAFNKAWHNWSHHIVVIINIHGFRLTDTAKSSDTINFKCFLPSKIKCRKQHSRKNCYNRNYNEKFYKGETNHMRINPPMLAWHKARTGVNLSRFSIEMLGKLCVKAILWMLILR